MYLRLVPDCGHETVPSAVSVAVSGSGTHADMQKTFRAKKTKTKPPKHQRSATVPTISKIGYTV